MQLSGASKASTATHTVKGSASVIEDCSDDEEEERKPRPCNSARHCFKWGSKSKRLIFRNFYLLSTQTYSKCLSQQNGQKNTFFLEKLPISFDIDFAFGTLNPRTNQPCQAFAALLNGAGKGGVAGVHARAARLVA